MPYWGKGGGEKFSNFLFFGTNWFTVTTSYLLFKFRESMSYLPRRPVNTYTESQQQLAVLQSVSGNQTDELCSICGEDMGDSHACLHDIPASLLTLQDPRIGTIFGEHYLLEEYASTGDTCFVYKARHQLLNSIFATKIPRTAASVDQFALLRAQRAAQIASRLDHPNIVRTIDLVCHAQETPILIMEWSGGKPLAQIIAQEAPLQPARALSIIEQVVDALTYARHHGINHIRLKAGTIMVQPGSSFERVKVLDFGIMKMLTTQKPSDVNDTSIYRSPEERDGHAPDERSSIYSVGMMLHEMLTEKFDDTVLNTNEKAVLPALVKVRADMKEASLFDDVLFKCIARQPEQRFHSLESLSMALDTLRLEVERMQSCPLKDPAAPSEKKAHVLIIEFTLVLLIVAALMTAFVGWQSIVPALH